MKTRAVSVLIVVLFIAGRTPAGSVDKAKLRELAHLPNIDLCFGAGFSTISGFHLGMNGDHPAEIARLQKQMKGDPSDAERYQLQGRHYGMMKREKEAKEAYAKAVAICRQQVREHPEDMGWLIRLGEALIRNEETKEGETLLRRVLKEAPNEWRAWLALAECVKLQSSQAIFGDKPWHYTFSGEKLVIPALMEWKPTEEQIAEMRRLWKEALRHYGRAVELAPQTETKPYYRRIAAHDTHEVIEAGLRMIKGEKIDLIDGYFAPECLADMRQIARLSPDDPQALGAVMFCEIIVCGYHNKLEMKEDCSSWADYLALRNRSLVDVLPAENRESVCWCMERLEQLTQHPDKATAAAASEILAEELMTIKNMSVGCEFLGISAQNEDIRAKTLEHLRRAIRLDPSRERSWDSLTAILSMTKQTDEAIVVATKRLALKDNAHNRFFLAKIYADNHQFDKAAEELRAGLKNEPEDLNCCLGLIALALKHEEAQALQEAGKQLQTLLPRIKEGKNKQICLSYLLLSGIYGALIDHHDYAKELFQQILQRKKGEPTATRALVALGGQLEPADQQLAIDFIKGRSGKVVHKDGQASLPVESISLYPDHKTDEDLFVLSAFPQLHELSLSFGTITDAGLAHLEDLTALQNLNLDGTEITDKGLLHLKALRGLRDLSLNETKITDVGLSYLDALQGLEGLHLAYSSITDAGLAHLRKFPKLRNIIVGSSITDKGLAHLAVIPQLRRLLMLSSKITDEGMQHLEQLTELEELWLSGAEITDAGIAHLKGLRNLRKLHLGGTKITDAGLAHLQEFFLLEELELDSTAISDAGLAHLNRLINLRKLNLRDNAGKKTGLSVSTKPPLTGKGLKYLASLTKLKHLDLDGRPITDGGLTAIEALPQVEYLSLGSTHITDEGLAHLRQLKQLHLVNVRNTKVTRQGSAELRKSLPKLEVYR